ncbi:hypothetical protein J2T57_001245 [Natronocella acetinitrilica]|uniref:Uncharacterized protein n=1 Tax=Natronocella acetinitrilica TaxID=414046 RepID=A0AAE3G4C0_9GAMM|nr:hypothetical protein [Natronocella acetinitrilica]MCP1674143.1 hypothetical protein [Natronocella acetinitrilica]
MAAQTLAKHRVTLTEAMEYAVAMEVMMSDPIAHKEEIEAFITRARKALRLADKPLVEQRHALDRAFATPTLLPLVSRAAPSVHEATMALLESAPVECAVIYADLPEAVATHPAIRRALRAEAAFESLNGPSNGGLAIRANIARAGIIRAASAEHPAQAVSDVLLASHSLMPQEQCDNRLLAAGGFVQSMVSEGCGIEAIGIAHHRWRGAVDCHLEAIGYSPRAIREQNRRELKAHRRLGERLAGKAVKLSGFAAAGALACVGLAAWVSGASVQDVAAISGELREVAAQQIATHVPNFVEGLDNFLSAGEAAYDGATTRARERLEMSPGGLRALDFIEGANQARRAIGAAIGDAARATQAALTYSPEHETRAESVLKQLTAGILTTAAGAKLLTPGFRRARALLTGMVERAERRQARVAARCLAEDGEHRP